MFKDVFDLFLYVIIVIEESEFGGYLNLFEKLIKIKDCDCESENDTDGKIVLFRNEVWGLVFYRSLFGFSDRNKIIDDSVMKLELIFIEKNIFDRVYFHGVK